MPTATLKPHLQRRADNIVRSLTARNAEYRAGTPTISDATYDALVASLAAINPFHPFLVQVEPESLPDSPISEGGVALTFEHGNHPMLSTQKCYSVSEFHSFLDKIEAAGSALGMDNPIVRVTPKLDGVAAKLFTDKLVTRGDGTTGNVVQDILNKGLVIKGKKPTGDNFKVGELVISNKYFNENLADRYANPRAVVAGIVNSKSLSEDARKILSDNALEIILFDDINAYQEPLSTVKENFDKLLPVFRNIPYQTDGVIFEAVDNDIKLSMASTSRHHNWQIAVKENQPAVQTTVRDISYSVSRTGVLSPTLVFDEVILNGAKTTRATGHSIKHIEEAGIGIGSVISVESAGDIIPKWVDTLKTVKVSLPTHCPTCSTALSRQGNDLICINSECSAQAVSAIIHHAATLKMKFFGKGTVEKLVGAGVKEISEIYTLSQEWLGETVGKGIAAKLVSEMVKVRDNCPDYLLLASLGLPHLGRTSSKKLLSKVDINDVMNLQSSNIVEIPSFGKLTSEEIAKSLSNSTQLPKLLSLGFNVTKTSCEMATATKGTVVFTGKLSETRDGMRELATRNGFDASSNTVKKTTSYLVCGENTGATKMEKARNQGVTLLTEAQFMAMCDAD